MMKLKCSYCNKDCEWVENKEIYGRNYGKSYMIWLCRDCDAYVGCHCNTKKPLGVVANSALRKLRKKAKGLFIEKKLKGKWKKNYREKEKAYNWLRKRLKISSDEAHFGMFDEEKCLKVIDILTPNKQ